MLISLQTFWLIFLYIDFFAPISSSLMTATKVYMVMGDLIDEVSKG